MSIDGQEYWKKIVANQTPGTAQIDDLFWESLNPHETVLEVGVGSGRVIDESLRRGLNIIAIDINKQEIENLRNIYETNEAVELLIADATKPLSLPRKVNGVVMLGLLGALNFELQRNDALRNCAAVTEPKSEVVVSEFLVDDTDEVLASRYKQGQKDGLERGSFAVFDDAGNVQYITHNFDEDELVSLVGRYATILSVSKTIFMSYHGSERKGIIVRARVE
jgi:ubiquinone/menaquinone biosynthesis C-methylase UbiE